MTLRNNREPLPCFWKLCVSYDNHPWIEINSYCPETLKLEPNPSFFCKCDREIWWMTFKNNRAPLLYYCKFFASYHSHLWIQTIFTVRKAQIGAIILLPLQPWSLTSDLDLFEWTSPLSRVITPENLMIRWQEHSAKGVMDRQRDRRIDRLTGPFIELLGRCIQTTKEITM